MELTSQFNCHHLKDTQEKKKLSKTISLTTYKENLNCNNLEESSSIQQQQEMLQDIHCQFGMVNLLQSHQEMVE